jgi:hypothetical protein
MIVSLRNSNQPKGALVKRVKEGQRHGLKPTLQNYQSRKAQPLI